MLPVYVINLNRRPERLASITESLRRLGLSFERIAAVDGAELSAAEDTVRTLGRAEHGCLVSHYEALRRFLASNETAALVLEDDAKVASDLPSALEGKDWWPPGRGLIKLDIVFGRPRYLGRVCGQTPSGRDLREMAMGNAGCAGYLIDRAAARHLLRRNDDPTFPIDRIMFDFRVSPTANHLRPVQCVPPMVAQSAEFESDIGTDRRTAQSAKARARGRFRRQYSSLAHKTVVLGLRAAGRLRRYPMDYRDHWPLVNEEPDDKSK